MLLYHAPFQIAIDFSQNISKYFIFVYLNIYKNNTMCIFHKFLFSCDNFVHCAIKKSRKHFLLFGISLSLAFRKIKDRHYKILNFCGGIVTEFKSDSSSSLSV